MVLVEDVSSDKDEDDSTNELDHVVNTGLLVDVLELNVVKALVMMLIHNIENVKAINGSRRIVAKDRFFRLIVVLAWFGLFMMIRPVINSWHRRLSYLLLLPPLV